MKDIKIMVFDYHNFAKRCSLYSQLRTEKEHLCENGNVEYSHILQISVYKAIASMFDQFRTNYSHCLLQK